MRDAIVSVATLLAAFLASQLWLACTDDGPMVQGYLGFAVLAVAVALLCALCAWLAAAPRSPLHNC